MIGNLEKTMARIKATEEDSPVVVTLAPKRGMFKSFFYSTVYGHDFVRMNPPTLVGVFHKEMSIKHVDTKLRQHL